MHPNRLFAWILPWLLVFLLQCTQTTSAEGALTPESPEVKRLIESGMKFLDGATDQRLGGKCLVGLCHFKHTGDAEHRWVVHAIEACQRTCQDKPDAIKADIYSTGIAIVFLCEVDAVRFSTEVERLVRSLILRQKPHGGWGYPSGPHASTGDTSMTQYAVLGLWTAKQHGIEVPDAVVAKVANWLVRTQDPQGGWGYQGKDPGNFERVEQAQVRHSLTAAGLGSTYICASMLGLSREGENRRIDGLPPAFERVADDPPVARREALGRVEPVRLRAAQNGGNRWFAENFAVENHTWVFYYLYAFERYVSFRELVEDRPQGGAWYDAGVRFLTEQQYEDGHWQAQPGGSVDTAFAILFLMRGTKKTIEKSLDMTRQWSVVGGRGLPKNTSTLRIRDGKLMGAPLAKSVEEMLAILEDSEHEDFDYAVEFPAPVVWSKLHPQQQDQHIRRWQRLAETGPAAVRKLAVEALSRSGRLHVAPTLIDALGDSDLEVVAAARDGLRRLSRRFDGFGLSDHPTAQEIRIAQLSWSRWYESVELPQPRLSQEGSSIETPAVNSGGVERRQP